MLLYYKTETIVEPLDMNEVNIMMPSLFDIGMHCGNPLQVLQSKLAHVRKIQNTTDQEQLLLVGLKVDVTAAY